MNFKEALCTQLPNTRESIYASIWHLGHVTCKKKKKNGKQNVKSALLDISALTYPACVFHSFCGHDKVFLRFFVLGKNAAWQPEIPTSSFDLSVTAVLTRKLEEEEKKKHIFENTFHLAKLRLFYLFCLVHTDMWGFYFATNTTGRPVM